MTRSFLCFAAATFLLSTPRLSRATPSGQQTSSFSIGQTTLDRGEGEVILKTFAPALANRGLGAQIEAELNATITDLASSVEQSVNTELRQQNFVPFAKRMADAGGMVARALPIDYATKFQVFSLTGAAMASGSTNLADLKVALDANNTDGIKAGDLDVGFSADLSLLLGINLAAFHLPKSAYFDPDRMQIYLSGMRVPVGDITRDSYSVDVWHVGLHGKYLLLGGKQLSSHYDLARWGGLAVATGFTYASQDIAFHPALPSSSQSTEYSLPSVNKSLTVNYNYAGNGAMVSHSDVYTIPIEVSSSLQLLYFLTLYAGGGLDMTWGESMTSASATDPVHVSLADGTQTLEVLDPTPSLALSVTESPTSFSGRGFFGLQINARVAAIFAQATADTTKTLGATAGLRLFW